MLTERTGIGRFLPSLHGRTTPSERAAQAVRERRERSEGSTWNDSYTVVQELVIPKALEVEGEDRRARILVMTYGIGRDWASIAVPYNPEKKSTDPATILGRITFKSGSVEEATEVADGWVDNSAGPLNRGDTEIMPIAPQIRDRYAQSIHSVGTNTP